MTIENDRKEYRNNERLVYSCQYHIVFCTKYKRNVLSEKMIVELNRVIDGLAGVYDFEIKDRWINEYSVHLLIDCNPEFSVIDCVKKIKNSTSGHLRETFPELKSKLPSLWTRNAFISSAGNVDISDIISYMDAQKNI